ncbi:uncharacterized protein G2W53_022651 [Senna tora]|uniref:Uncharacterized protein n=1 Tax=Senna tora TaxID=362788 RepID=A0A834TN25_9FABA|nr:uncharacterized protein G2W53_022651 [Senna tora]
MEFEKNEKAKLLLEDWEGHSQFAFYRNIGSGFWVHFPLSSYIEGEDVANCLRPLADEFTISPLERKQVVFGLFCAGGSEVDDRNHISDSREEHTPKSQPVSKAEIHDDTEIVMACYVGRPEGAEEDGGRGSNCGDRVVGPRSEIDGAELRAMLFRWK